MPQPSRRRFLQATGGLLLAAALPSSAAAGVLNRLFGQPEPKLTKSITPNDEFYVTSYRSPPTIRLNEWSLVINGLVERPMTLTYDQLLAKPTISQIVTLECVGNTVAGEFISTAEWEGVSLRALLEEAGVSARAYDVVFRAADGYSDGIRLDRAMAGDVLIAHSMNGVPLPSGPRISRPHDCARPLRHEECAMADGDRRRGRGLQGLLRAEGLDRRGDRQDDLTHRSPRTWRNNSRPPSHHRRIGVCRHERHQAGRSQHRRRGTVGSRHTRPSSLIDKLGILVLRLDCSKGRPTHLTGPCHGWNRQGPKLH